MMDGNALIALLGHASDQGPLDAFLTRHGVVVRPAGGNDTGLVRDKKSGLAFEYRDQDSFEESVGKPCASGLFILRGVDFYSDMDGYRAFTGTLPFGATFSMAETQMAALLGQPRKTLAGDKNEGPQHSYCLRELLVVAKFRAKGEGVSWLRAALPTHANRRQGLCP